MKILFCDVDGVIWSYRTYQFSAEACKNLNDLLDQEPELKIVISSSWRKLGRQQVDRTFNKNGIDITRIIDMTGTEPGGRGDEVQAWLDAHSEVTSFVILDDEQEDFPKLMDRLVKPDRYICLTQDDVRNCVDILKRPC